MTSIPFDPPTILVGQRKTGLVIVPDAEESEADPLDLSWNATASGSSLTDTDTTNTNGRAALRRRASLNGNILHVPDRKESYFMQRKIGKTAYGSVRVGFLLETNLDDSGLSGYMSTEYDVVRSDGPYPFEMVAIKVYDQKKMDDEGEGAQTELAALEMIAKAENGGAASLFVQYSHCVCADSNSVYVIVPFHGEGTLFQYVVESGTLSEPVARHYFQQILKGLQTLQNNGLCHRNISLDSIRLCASDCTLTELGSCLRISSSSSSALLPTHMATGGNPRYIAPEVIQTDSFNGQAADLWAAGICLCGMLFGTEAPFVWASDQDRRFVEICKKGNLRGCKFAGGTSEEAVDLIQSMLRANPSDRLTLDQCMQHAWLQGETVAPQLPTPVMTKRESTTGTTT